MKDFKPMGEPKKATLSWRYRKQGIEQFDYIDVIKEAVNNTVEDSIKNNIFPKLVIEYNQKQNYFLIQDEGTGAKINNFIRFGESDKVNMIGQYGHGFKDCALLIGKSIVVGTEQGNWKVYQDDNFTSFYVPCNGLNIKKGTCFIIPLKKDIIFDYRSKIFNRGRKYTGEKAIKKLIMEYAALALYYKNIEIEFNGEKLIYNFPQGKEVSIKFDKKRDAYGLLLPNESGLLLYTQGGYLLDARETYDTDGMLLLNMDFITGEENIITTKKQLRLRHPIWEKKIKPQLIKWMEENNILDRERAESEEFKMLSYLLKPFIIGDGETVPSKQHIQTQVKHPYVKSGKYAGQKRGKIGGPPILIVDDPALPLFVDITPEEMVINIAYPLYALIKTMPKKWQLKLFTILCASRAVYLTHDNYDDLDQRREDWAKEDKGLLKLLKKNI